MISDHLETYLNFYCQPVFNFALQEALYKCVDTIQYIIQSNDSHSY